jgi:hypothetical protein
VPLDVRGNPDDFCRAVQNVDAVVHAAGITRARRSEDYYSVNAGGTRRVAAAALRAGARRFVLISSLAARGPDGHDHPESDYGRSKLEAETHLLALGGRMEAVVLRPAAVYGPRDTDLLPLFRMARAGWLPVPRGAAPLQPIYAEDAARAALAAAREPVGFGPFPVAENRRYACPMSPPGSRSRSGVRFAPWACPRAPSCLRGVRPSGRRNHSRLSPSLTSAGLETWRLTPGPATFPGPGRRWDGGRRSLCSRVWNAPPGGTGRWGGLV